MTLIKSISGIRGTIGGKPDEGLTPIDIVKFTSAFGTWTKRNHGGQNIKVVVGRDARISGEMVNQLVTGTLIGLGIDVINLGLATTPTVEVAVENLDAQAGIILTASHNPKQWNALKLLNAKGEFISGDDGSEVLNIADKNDFDYAEVDELGEVKDYEGFLDTHIQKILDLPLVDVNAIKSANFKVVIDCVNSVGGIAVPALLDALGVQNVTKLFCEPNGQFPHNPEPLPENLIDIAQTIQKEGADLGIVVDPDVDRLAMVNEDGSMFGEEYTLVAVADYVLSNTPGNTVSNLSSTRALRDVTEFNGQQYFPAAVGEVNVVNQMKSQRAIIGGEGNGGVIYPALHYGRDALVGIALFLTHLAKTGKKCSELRAQYPAYHISKNKIALQDLSIIPGLLDNIATKYAHENVNRVDGVKIDFANEWVHMRASNTEPIIRIYAESKEEKSANELAHRFVQELNDLL